LWAKVWGGLFRSRPTTATRESYLGGVISSASRVQYRSRAENRLGVHSDLEIIVASGLASADF